MLEESYGVALLTMLYGWGHLLKRLPWSISERLLRATDDLARNRPALSDVIVTVWKPRPQSETAAS